MALKHWRSALPSSWDWSSSDGGPPTRPASIAVLLQEPPGQEAAQASGLHAPASGQGTRWWTLKKLDAIRRSKAAVWSLDLATWTRS